MGCKYIKHNIPEEYPHPVEPSLFPFGWKVRLKLVTHCYPTPRYSITLYATNWAGGIKTQTLKYVFYWIFISFFYEWIIENLCCITVVQVPLVGCLFPAYVCMHARPFRVHCGDLQGTQRAFPSPPPPIQNGGLTTQGPFGQVEEGNQPEPWWGTISVTVIEEQCPLRWGLWSLPMKGSPRHSWLLLAFHLQSTL